MSRYNYYHFLLTFNKKTDPVGMHDVKAYRNELKSSKTLHITSSGIDTIDELKTILEVLKSHQFDNYRHLKIQLDVGYIFRQDEKAIQFFMENIIPKDWPAGFCVNFEIAKNVKIDLLRTAKSLPDLGFKFYKVLDEDVNGLIDQASALGVSASKNMILNFATLHGDAINHPLSELEMSRLTKAFFTNLNLKDSIKIIFNKENDYNIDMVLEELQKLPPSLIPKKLILEHSNVDSPIIKRLYTAIKDSCLGQSELNLKINLAASSDQKILIEALNLARYHHKLKLSLVSMSLLEKPVVDYFMEMLASGNIHPGNAILYEAYLVSQKNSNYFFNQFTKVLASGHCPDHFTFSYKCIRYSEHGITDENIILLADALCHPDSPSSLKLTFSSHALTDRAAKKIIALLKTNKCPHDLNIKLVSNNISIRLTQEIEHLVDINKIKNDAYRFAVIQQKKVNGMFLPQDVLSNVLYPMITSIKKESAIYKFFMNNIEKIPNRIEQLPSYVFEKQSRQRCNNKCKMRRRTSETN